MRFKRTVILLGLSLCLPIQTSLGAWTSVGTGIDYQEFVTADPNNLFVARLDRTETDAFIESSIAQGKTSGGTETVSSQASRYDDAIGYWTQTWGTTNDVVVAINGSYYNTSTGVPDSGVIHSGSYDKRFTNVTGTSGFVWDLNRYANVGECVSHYSTKQIVTYVDSSSNTQYFQGINVAPGDNQLTIFTANYDDSTGTDSTGSEVLIQLTTPFLLKPTPAYVTGTVIEIRQSAGDTTIPFDHIVLSAKGTAATTMLANVSVGDTVHVSQEIKSYETDCSTARSLDWTKAYGSIASNWVFLRNSVIQTGIDSSGETHPRTAIGLNADYVFFIVCDGRDPGTSVGMTIDELADFCKNTLGCTWACNQDGGGSSTMVVNGTVMNNPSDGSERSVANGMMMCNVVSRSLSTTLATDDTVETNASADLLLGPGTNYPTLTTLSSSVEGTVEAHAINGVAAKSDNWWQVDFNGTVGWIAESLIDEVLPPTTCHVDSIVASAYNAGGGNKRGRATVTVKDNNGDPVSSATVTGDFTGDYSETQSAVTNANGVAVIETTATVKRPSFTFCVTGITHASLTYASGDNVVTCDSY